MTYILALLPPQQAALIYVQVAQLLFAPINDGYVLSQTSLPHITVCAFETDDEQKVYEVWKDLEQLRLSPMHVQFFGVGFIKRGQDSYWVDLSVVRDEEILKIQRLAIGILQSHGLRCLTETGNLYRPHLTLARVKLADTVHRWPDSMLESPAQPFRLAIGQAGPNGQFIRQIR